MAIFGRRRWAHLDCSVHGPLSPQDVLDMTFVMRKVGGGYDPDEVDDYLDSVAAAMAGFAPPVSAWDIRQHEFTRSRKFKSFDPEEVDDFLECIAQTLEGRAGEYSSNETDTPWGLIEGQGTPGGNGFPGGLGFPGGQELPSPPGFHSDPRFQAFRPPPDVHPSPPSPSTSL